MKTEYFLLIINKFISKIKIEIKIKGYIIFVNLSFVNKQPLSHYVHVDHHYLLINKGKYNSLRINK